VSAVVELTLRSLHAYRRPLLVWMAALAAMGLVLTLFWPSIRDTAGLDELVASLPEALRALIGTEDLLSPEGFLASRLNSIFPLLITVYAAFRVTAETSGEEQRGGFEILLGTPLPRTTLLLARFLAVSICVVALMTATGVALIVGAVIVDMPLSYANVLATTSGLALLGIVFGALSLAVAAGTGNRGLTLGVGAGLAVTAFFLYSFAPLTPRLEGIRPFTLFEQILANEPLRNGLDLGGVLVLVAVTVVAMAVAVTTFRRRDLHGT
jgi:ABC-2 type transport system permease protein